MYTYDGEDIDVPVCQQLTECLTRIGILPAAKKERSKKHRAQEGA